ncbi:hypothetical protein [Lysinibacter sp. HNR]|uniref:hypothetical protein n=1 Tax=Lysinibacter sp. HNR TaxID=3031408 RepID=UPI00243567DC|nr:hypothetical protein [Lysinibacter sp. HNR]WGD38291.1 hypothetical protein FrondiHNR_05080 [Lysinibacter sp. HNR]
MSHTQQVPLISVARVSASHRQAESTGADELRAVECEITLYRLASSSDEWVYLGWGSPEEPGTGMEISRESAERLVQKLTAFIKKVGE